jgi:hypothetical protein
VLHIVYPSIEALTLMLRTLYAHTQTHTGRLSPLAGLSYDLYEGHKTRKQHSS